MSKMFDTTVTMGNIIQIVVILISGLIFLYRMESRLVLLTNIQENFTQRLSKIDAELEKLASVTIQIARQDERMTAQDVRLQEFSNRLEDLGKLTKLLLPPARVRRSKD